MIPNRILAVALALALSAAAQAQVPPPPQGAPPPPPPGAIGVPPVAAAPALAPEQLDQMLAPIALYPDPLLTQILAAATYPLEVVEASRWIQASPYAAQRGQMLDQALAQQNWDPSVKSLVPFPQILTMMDQHLDWTQSLGSAFLAQQPDVMDSIQRLRQEARDAGTLYSTAQQQVIFDGSYIAIEPVSQQIVYVPIYDPSIYGRWRYADYPPDYWGPPPGLTLGTRVGALGFSVGLGVVAGLWHWGDWDWRHHDVRVDPQRFNQINAGRPPVAATQWHHDPARRGPAPVVRANVAPNPAERERGAGVASPRAPSVTQPIAPVAPTVAHPAVAPAQRTGAPGEPHRDEHREPAAAVAPHPPAPAPAAAAAAPHPPAPAPAAAAAVAPHPPVPAVQRPAPAAAVAPHPPAPGEARPEERREPPSARVTPHPLPSTPAEAAAARPPQIPSRAAVEPPHPPVATTAARPPVAAATAARPPVPAAVAAKPPVPAAAAAKAPPNKEEAAKEKTEHPQ